MERAGTNSLGPPAPGRSAPDGRPEVAGPSPRAGVLGVGALLVAAVVIVFGQTLGHGFLNYDDDAYVYENPLVREGLSPGGIARAFGTAHSFTWHPLTTLSHMLDVELYGLKTAGHHLSSLLLHAATAVLLFAVLARMTGARACSAFVALVFAVHPQRVESVAWISERKDVLSGLFFVLSLGAYARYARARASGASFPFGPYLATLACFALGLLSKPMVVSLPFVLLLVDRWPLERLGEPGAPLRHLRPRLVEKLPFFALSVVCGAITLSTQEGAMTSSETLGLAARVENAVVAYAVYLRQVFLPTALAVVYPHARDGLAPSVVALSGLLVAGLSAAVVARCRQQPYLLVGWLWFLGMLVPVIGLVQVGVQSHADRYTYLPHIGLYLMLAWGAAAGWPRALDRRVLHGLGAVVVAALAIQARQQAALWHSSEALWRHTLACTTRNGLAHAQLGVALADSGKLDEAVEHYRAALEIQPDHATPRYNLGNALASRGDLDGAIEQYGLALRAKPRYAKAHNNLGTALVLRGRTAEAVEAYTRALEADPGYVEARVNLAEALGKLGIALASANRLEEAIEHFRRALELEPGSAAMLGNLGMALEHRGDRAGAALQYRRALELARTRGDEKLAGVMRARLQQLGE